MAFLCACSGLPNEENNNGNSHEGNGNPEEDVTARSLCPDDNHPHAIDLGIGLKWSCCNVGASAPWEYGDYYAWGETEPYYSSQDPLIWKDGKTGYNEESYKWGKWENSYYKLTKYCPLSKTENWGGEGEPDGKTVLESGDDVAHVKSGGNWRMPTANELTELMERCSWTWVTDYNGTGINGRIVTATNGNSIFLPAAGLISATEFSGVGSYCFYWSSSLNIDSPVKAKGIYFDSEHINLTGSTRYYYGRLVRPVSD